MTFSEYCSKLIHPIWISGSVRIKALVLLAKKYKTLNCPISKTNMSDIE